MSEYSRKLHNTINELIDLVKSRYSEYSEHNHDDKWGKKEVLAHIVFWHEQYAEILDDIISYRDPHLLNGTYMRLNEHAIEHYRDYSPSQLTTKLKRAQEHIDRVSSHPDSDNLHIRFKQEGKERPFDFALGGIDAHIRGHLLQLKRKNL